MPSFTPPAPESIIENAPEQDAKKFTPPSPKAIIRQPPIPYAPKANPRPMAGRLADMATSAIGGPSGLGIAGFARTLSNPAAEAARASGLRTDKPLIDVAPSDVPKGAAVEEQVGAGLGDFIGGLLKTYSTPDQMAPQNFTPEYVMAKMITEAPEALKRGKEALAQGDYKGATESFLPYVMGSFSAAHLADKVLPDVAPALKKMPLASAEATKEGVSDATKPVPSPTGVPIPALRQEVGGEAPLRQQGEAPQARQEAQAQAPEIKPEHQAVLDLEAKNAGVPVELHQPTDPNEPFAGQIAQPDRARGVIRINPKELSAWLDTEVPKGKEAEAVRSLLSEERIHLGVTDADALAYHESLTPLERTLGRKIYGDPGAQLSPTMLGHEMLRMRMQQLARMTVRETLQRSLKERWSVKSLLALNDAIRGIRETLGTKASKEGLAILDKVQENLNGALGKNAPIGPVSPGAAQRRYTDQDSDEYKRLQAQLKGLKFGEPGFDDKFVEIGRKMEAIKNKNQGYAPGTEPQEPSAARRKSDQTPEFYLPPVKEGVERPGASEAGALASKWEAPLPPTELRQSMDAWRPITDTKWAYKVGDELTKPLSERSSKEPVSTTNNLLAMRNKKTGEVALVSVYKDPEDPSHAKAVDPSLIEKNHERPNVGLINLFQRYEPIAGMTLDHSTQNFYRKFKSEDDFDQKIGGAAKALAGQHAKYEVPETGFEDRAEGEAASKVPVTQAPSHEMTPFINRDESDAIKTHVAASKTHSQAVESLKTSTNKELLKSGLLKATQAIQQRMPSITPEEAWATAFNQIYETSKSSKSAEAHHQSLLIQFGDADNEESRGLQGSDAPGAARRRIPQAVDDEIKLTKEDLTRFISGKRTLNQVSRLWASVENAPHIVSRNSENHIRFASIEKKPDTLAGRMGDWTRGDKDRLAAANAMVQLGGVRDDGSIDLTAKGNIPAARYLVQKGIDRAQGLLKTGLWDGEKPQGSAIVNRIRAKRIIASNTQLLKELDYAEKNWSDATLQNTAKAARDVVEGQIKAEHDAGFPVEREANYDPQRYLDSGNPRSILFGGDTLRIIGKRFRLGRKYHSYYEAAADGFIPVTRDIASLSAHRVRQGQYMIARDLWQRGLPGMQMGDGRPLAVETTQAKGRYTKEFAPPEGFTDYKMVPGLKNELAIHPDAVSLIDNLIAPSKVQHWAITRNALKFSQALKHSLLAGDLFHFGRITGYALSIMGKNEHRSALGAMDISERDIPRALDLGIISPAEAKWGQELIRYGKEKITRRAAIEKFYKEMGANLGQIQDALYKELITNITPGAGLVAKGVHAAIDPSFGRYQRFLFDKYTRGLMAAANVTEFERQMKANPKLNPDALMRDIATDNNNYFGNIGQQGAIKSKTMQDLSRMILLAPGWEEGLIRKELSFYGRISGISKLAGQRAGVTALGTTGRGIGRGLLFMMGLTQAVNLISRRQFTWKNNEQDHKWDAFIPAWDGSAGFWFSPMAFFNETTHDMYQLMQGNKTFMQAADQIFGNKEAPLTRAGLLTFVGTDQSGERFGTSGGQLKAAASKLAPTPITFGKYAQAAGHAIAPGTVSPVPPGQVQRQTMASMGFKVQPRLTPLYEIMDLAQKYVRDNKLKPDSGWTEQQVADAPSYTKLRSALRIGDQKEALKQFKALQDSHTDQQIYNSMKQWSTKPFTGKQSAERQFVSSLLEADLQKYWQAQGERQSLYNRFLDFAVKVHPSP